MPQNAAGWRIEPPVSEPSAAGASRAATAAAEPPLDPPGTRAGSQGLRVGPVTECSVADGVDLLFGTEPNAADLYHTAPGYRVMNRLVAAAVESAVSALPGDRRLRVLEVGAGTGGTTSVLLPLLPEGRTDYTCSDISAGFFASAQERLGGGGGIEYRVLDIERDPSAQGFDAHRYGLVVAANVLHATRNLGETLAHCRRLLAPSGDARGAGGRDGPGLGGPDLRAGGGVVAVRGRLPDRPRAGRAAGVAAGAGGCRHRRGGIPGSWSRGQRWLRDPGPGTGGGASGTWTVGAVRRRRGGRRRRGSCVRARVAGPDGGPGRRHRRAGAAGGRVAARILARACSKGCRQRRRCVAWFTWTRWRVVGFQRRRWSLQRI